MCCYFFPVRTSAVEGQQVDLPPGGLRGQVHGHVSQVHRRNDDGLNNVTIVILKS